MSTSTPNVPDANPGTKGHLCNVNKNILPKVSSLLEAGTCIICEFFSHEEAFNKEIHNRDIRNNKKLNIPKAKTNYGSNSIKVVGAKRYNQVPEDLQNVETEKKLKQLVKMYLLSKY